MSMNIEAEIRDLKRRVSELEGSFGFLTQQIKSVHRDLLAFQAKTEQALEQVNGRIDQVNGRIDQVSGRIDQVNGRIDMVDRGLRELRTDMPKIVGDTMREVLEINRRKKP
jgi:predicted  nucleic acid-binding Zn-ribbon protein